LAPEIVSGPFGHSYEVDYWAIGVISFALLFGKSPFQSKTENETLERIKQCKYEFPVHCLLFLECSSTFISQRLYQENFGLRFQKKDELTRNA